MQAVLLVMADSEGCDRAQRTWSAVCRDRGIELEVLSVDEAPGGALGRRLRLTTFPALVIGDAVVAVGVPSLEDAAALLERQPG